MSKTKENPVKKPLMAIVFCILLILGVTLIFKWWAAVVIFFQGILGMLLAGSALLGLYSLSK